MNATAICRHGLNLTMDTVYTFIFVNNTRGGKLAFRDIPTTETTFDNLIRYVHGVMPAVVTLRCIANCAYIVTNTASDRPQKEEGDYKVFNFQ